VWLSSIALLAQPNLISLFNEMKRKLNWRSRAREQGERSMSPNGDWVQAQRADNGGWPASLIFSFINQLLAFHAQPQLNNSRKEDSLPRGVGPLGAALIDSIPLRGWNQTNQQRLINLLSLLSFHYITQLTNHPFSFINSWSGVCGGLFPLSGAMAAAAAHNPLNQQHHHHSISLITLPQQTHQPIN